MSSSTIYTVGTALNRAHDNQLLVDVLVEGQWLTGNVMAVDGHGVVLQGDALDHSVVRMECVAAVRVLGAAPAQADLHTAISSSARPMPAGETAA